MAEYQVLYWREIPAQIRVYANGRPTSHKLPDRFQEEIDRVAMQEGLVNSEAYLDQWTWTEKMNRPGDPREVAEQVIRELSEART